MQVDTCLGYPPDPIGANPVTKDLYSVWKSSSSGHPVSRAHTEGIEHKEVGMCYDPFMSGWRRPAYTDEYDALKAASISLDLPLRKIVEAFKSGELVDLEGWIWCSLDNTDSNECFCLAEAEARAKLHGRDEALSQITTGMIRHKTLPAPVILMRGERRPYLVAGNLRLLACRALNTRPKAWLMHLENIDGS